jgi:hypothetical protein
MNGWCIAAKNFSEIYEYAVLTLCVWIGIIVKL